MEKLHKAYSPYVIGNCRGQISAKKHSHDIRIQIQRPRKQSLLCLRSSTYKGETYSSCGTRQDEDDDYYGFWQFLCGQDHAEINGRVISMKEATNLDNSINDLYKMPFDSIADRESINDEWLIKKSE